MEIRQYLSEAATRLQEVSDTPRLDAELLLCHALGVNRTYLFTWPERELEPVQASHFAALLARREAGEPVAHILGEREFWSLSLKVDASTLIPRPETELLVEAALVRIPVDAVWAIADLGTGSGAIALAVADERPACRITAVERSEEALAVARENMARHALGNVELHQGSWYGPLGGRRFHLILSNPPYIRADDPHLRQGDVRFEPMTALASGVDGLDDIRHIIAGAADHLEPGGWLLLEHGYDQGAAVCALLRAAGFIEVTDLADLQGHGRVALGHLPTP